MKLCTKCGIEKSLDSFYNYKKGPLGRSYRCKDCDTQARRAYRERQCPKKKRTMARARILRHKYGIELSDYDEMVAVAGGVCEICKGPPTNYQGYEVLCVDHCHATGKVRGLLCSKCNQALGLLQDSLKNLESAVSYLKERSEIH